MSDRFHPISARALSHWVFSELDAEDTVFGFPRSAFFVPSPDDRFKTSVYGQTIDTPFGVAAGPHTQMAQNIIVAWLHGARFIELKTVQTLDELDVPKPCIDCQDEGYNVEWSQELKVHESFEEYLRAWVLIHALHKKLGFPGEGPGLIFNMSVGYDYAGIHQPNVQWYLDSMRDGSDRLSEIVDIVAEDYPDVRDIDIPNMMSDTITLSTMHGCPPDEIEMISQYLMEERHLHTSVKLNPTLLGPEGVRTILEDLGYVDVPVPDEAFGHDLRYEDAVPMLRRLKAIGDREGLTFGVKLTNTLEVLNFRDVFTDPTMYMSGRALHAITTNVANKLNHEFDGELLMSFAGGADAFNVPWLLAAGMSTITVCSDLLKSGGYMRMLQYFETTNDAFDHAGASNRDEFIVRTAAAGGGIGEDLVRTSSGENLNRYADEVRASWDLKKGSFLRSRSKTVRPLDLFDCIAAPCEDECPVNQRVPEYMRAVREGDWGRAVDVTRQDNPIPTILGQVCDHLCEQTCIRTHYDEPLAIRDMKRFVMTLETEPPRPEQNASREVKVAIIGAGPAGMSAAELLAAEGFAVTMFEQHPYPGGMVAGAIPEYRLPQEHIDKDMRVVDDLGVETRFGQVAGRDFTVSQLRKQGYRYVIVAAGAQIGKRLGLEGEDADGVMDALHFLRAAREGHPVEIGSRVAVIGAGDTAMDCARTSWRLGADDVTVVYRRTIDQMPADREEVHLLLEEGIAVEELTTPIELHVESGALAGLVCVRNEYRGDRDRSGRKIPYMIEGSEFEIPFDTMILAISQHALIDFFDEEMPALTRSGYLDVDSATMETSIPGVFAAGDVAAPGPASIVKAAGDAKTAATTILAREGTTVPPAPRNLPVFSVADVLVRKAHRDYRVPVTHVPLEERKNFRMGTHAYTVEEAQKEASRCLDCDLYCSICVGVCPNMALMTYAMEPVSFELTAVRFGADSYEIADAVPFAVDQGYQIAVLTDFCNECGNCVTFCPTAGEPYRDKPRLYLNREDFLSQSDNAFMLFDDAMEGRFGGETHRVEMNGALSYRSPRGEVHLDPDSLAVLDASGEDGASVLLEPAATMVTIMNGLTESMPHVPRANG